MERPVTPPGDMKDQPGRPMIADGLAASAIVRDAVELSIAGNHRTAIERASIVLDAIDLLDSGAILSLAAVFAFGARVDNALDLYDRVLALEPSNPEALRGRAMALRFKGDIEASEAAFDTHLALCPRDYEAQYLRTSLRVQTQGRNHVAMLEGLIDGDIDDWREISTLAFALSKELHDLGQHDAAWFHLGMGARIKRRHLDYDIARDEATMVAIARAFDEGALGQGGGCHSTPAPLFIVGLPRSGSTLVERMLGSHPSIESVGESTAFPNVVRAMLGGRGDFDDPHVPALSLDLDPAAIGRAYLETVGAFDRRCDYLIDKLPINFRHVGLIRRALPTARIVDVRRAPIAACFAMFRHLFSDAYPFSYDLAECARYYGAYQGLMDHWNRVLPGHVIGVRYEAFVADHRGEAQRLVHALSLPWNDDCLRFASNPQPSLTASAAQVRRPLYDTAIKGWLPYADKLRPLRDALLQVRVTPERLA